MAAIPAIKYLCRSDCQPLSRALCPGYRITRRYPKTAAHGEAGRRRSETQNYLRLRIRAKPPRPSNASVAGSGAAT